MSSPPQRSLRIPFAGATLFLMGAVGGVLLADRLPESLRRLVRPAGASTAQAADHHDSDEPHADEASHEGHDHEEHDTHAEETSLELSEAAMANLGLTGETLRPVETATFVRSVTVPAVVAELPGRSRHPVTTPMTAVVTHVHAVTGEAVLPGTLLFQLRLTHEDLVNSQKEFLATVSSLDVEEKEVARIEAVSQSGALPGKVLLERQYARDKLKASLESQREALRLHGLTPEQVASIERDRRLLTELKVYAPGSDHHNHPQESEPHLRSDRPARGAELDDAPPGQLAAPPVLVVKSLLVHKGETVETGDSLCVLADYAELYIEGQAFESDAAAIAEARRRGWTAAAVVEQQGREVEVAGLPIAYLANEVEDVSRTLPFYVSLQNEIVDDTTNDRDQRYVAWRYRPGQRVQLRVPVEEWADQLVLPVAAVVKEGPDSFVFQQNGDHFDRVAVHERHRDRTSVVVANDGSIFPGDVVALTGAHQMQLALKNKAGGGIDPHAGHNH